MWLNRDLQNLLPTVSIHLVCYPGEEPKGGDILFVMKPTTKTMSLVSVSGKRYKERLPLSRTTGKVPSVPKRRTEASTQSDSFTLRF